MLFVIDNALVALVPPKPLSAGSEDVSFYFSQSAAVSHRRSFVGAALSSIVCPDWLAI